MRHEHGEWLALAAVVALIVAVVGIVIWMVLEGGR